MKKEGISCRFVVSRDKTLSSVVVEQNKLVNGGRELVLIAEDNGLLIGVTEAVQPFKELSFRDFGRPGRDDFSGMLPPKLAQIMINLARGDKNNLLIDPFCGSGTILTEALMMGYTKVEGSDISDKAIVDSKKNIDWVTKKFNISATAKVRVADARSLGRFYKAGSVAAIVSETYLGPQRGHLDMKKITRELSDLYSAVLREIEIVLKPGARAVIALPIFLPSKTSLSPKTPSGLQRKESYIYSRAGQSVGREIIIFGK